MEILITQKSIYVMKQGSVGICTGHMSLNAVQLTQNQEQF